MHSAGHLPPLGLRHRQADHHLQEDRHHHRHGYRHGYRDADADVSFNYALKDLRVGDMPQANMALGITLTPIEGAVLQFNYRYYDNHYADWGVSSREYADGTPETDIDRFNSWIAPSYGVLDIHGSYDLPLELGSAKPSLFIHVFNALDEVYIQDATDNSRYNSWGSPWHGADDAEVFFGLPMSFNAGLSIAF